MSPITELEERLVERICCGREDHATDNCSRLRLYRHAELICSPGWFYATKQQFTDHGLRLTLFPNSDTSFLATRMLMIKMLNYWED